MDRITFASDWVNIGSRLTGSAGCSTTTGFESAAVAGVNAAVALISPRERRQAATDLEVTRTILHGARCGAGFLFNPEHVPSPARHSLEALRRKGLGRPSHP